MKIAIVGASGFIGSALTHSLLTSTNHELVLFSHQAKKLTFTTAEERRITHVDGSVLQSADITAALQNCDIAVYLVHLMGMQQKHGAFMDAEVQAAHNFAKAVVSNKVRRVIYVGGMADSDKHLTNHLRSRQRTGQIIGDQVNQLIELRTPMVIGTGGAGYEILRSIVLRSVLFPLPRWARATTQPITVDDVVRYIMASITLATTEHLSIDIGGPQRLSYEQIARRIAAHHNKRLVVIPLPFVPKRLAVSILRLVTPANYAATMADMIESAGYSTQPLSGLAQKMVPQIIPENIDNAL